MRKPSSRSNSFFSKSEIFREGVSKRASPDSSRTAGIKPKRGIGTVQVKGTLEDGKAVLTVSDTGAGMSRETLDRILGSLDSDDAPGFGVFAVWQRLKLTFGDSFTFDIESEENSGTTVRICLPYSPRMEETA